MDMLPIRRFSPETMKTEYLQRTSPSFQRYLEEAAEDMFDWPSQAVPHQNDLWILTAAVNRMSMESPAPAVFGEGKPSKKQSEKYRAEQARVMLPK